MPRVAIIGAGPAGLASAKSALECGLAPIIFEQSSKLGGLWRSEEGSMWNSMRTNLSHFNCMFSDFPWEDYIEDYEDFPTQAQMCVYLEAYAKQFGLSSCMRFSTKVINIAQQAAGWHITSQTSQGDTLETFQFVIIATGVFTEIFTPQISGIEKFKGLLTHTKDYKSPEQYKDKHVAVIGGAFSGAEIAAEITSQAKSVTNIIRHPFWILPRYIPQDLNKPERRLPLDLVFYKRSSRPSPNEIPLSAEEMSNRIKDANKKKHTYFSLLQNGDQGLVSPALQMDATSEDPVRTIISDSYLEKVSQKKISIQKAQIKQITETEIILEDETALPVDVILFATGYQLKLPFFDEAIKKTLNFAPQDQLQPLLLHKSTWHPELPNMAFVGMYRGPYFAIMELQARWAAMVFSEKVLLPSHEVMLEGVDVECTIREQHPRPQFPHGDYIAFADSLAQEIGMPKDLQSLKSSDELIHKVLWNGPVVSAHFRFFGYAANKQLALATSEAALARVTSAILPTLNLK